MQGMWLFALGQLAAFASSLYNSREVQCLSVLFYNALEVTWSASVAGYNLDVCLTSPLEWLKWLKWIHSISKAWANSSKEFKRMSKFAAFWCWIMEQELQLSNEPNWPCHSNHPQLWGRYLPGRWPKSNARQAVYTLGAHQLTDSFSRRSYQKCISPKTAPLPCVACLNP